MRRACSIRRPANTCRCRCSPWAANRWANTRTRSATACWATLAASHCTSISGTRRRASGSRSNRARRTAPACATRSCSAMHFRLQLILTMGILTMLGGCKSSRPPITTAPKVELERFMGPWYVIGNIPTSIEREAFNPVESYELDADGTIATTFSFREGSLDGPLKTYCPRGFVLDTRSNAVWGMRFVWPIKADYRNVYVSENYEHTIVGREKRDYLWIMARTPQIA